MTPALDCQLTTGGVDKTTLLLPFKCLSDGLFDLFKRGGSVMALGGFETLVAEDVLDFLHPEAFLV